MNGQNGLSGRFQGWLTTWKRVVKPTGGYLLKPITVIISCLNLEVTVKATQGPHTSHLSVEQKEERPTHHCAFLLLTLLSL